MANVKVILNPHAGRGRGRGRIPEVERALNDAGIDHELLITEGHGHGMELASRSDPSSGELVVAAGGDGTVNEVVNGLVHAAAGGPVGPIGVLPIGTGNDFAEAMGVPLDLQQAARRLAQAKVRQVDLGCVNERFFGNSVGIGFEAQVSALAQSITRLQGLPLYLLAVFRALVRYPLPVVDLSWDGGQLNRKPVLMVTVGNGHRIGGGFLVTPDAVPDDGLLDLCIADAIPRWQILRLLPKVLRGAHRDEPVIHLTRSTALKVESEDPLPVHADGEVLWTDAHRLEISLEPGRLQVVV